MGVRKTGSTLLSRAGGGEGREGRKNGKGVGWEKIFPRLTIDVCKRVNSELMINEQYECTRVTKSSDRSHDSHISLIMGVRYTKD